MSLLSLLGWKTRRYECCDEAHEALRRANALIDGLRHTVTDLVSDLVDASEEIERARLVATTFLCCDGIDHGDES